MNKQNFYKFHSPLRVPTESQYYELLLRVAAYKFQKYPPIKKIIIIRNDENICHLPFEFETPTVLHVMPNPYYTLNYVNHKITWQPRTRNRSCCKAGSCSSNSTVSSSLVLCITIYI